MVKEQLEKRRAELKRDFEEGNRQVAQLEQQVLVLREGLLRISGGIIMIDELLAACEQPLADAARANE